MSAPCLIVPGLYELCLSMPMSSVNVFFLLTADGVTLIDTGYPDRGVGVLAGLWHWAGLRQIYGTSL